MRVQRNFVAPASRRLLAFEFVNRPAGRFILRSRCAGSKGRGQLQLGALDLVFAVGFDFVAAACILGGRL